MLELSEYRRILFRPIGWGILLVVLVLGFLTVLLTYLCFKGIIREPEFGPVSEVSVGSAMGPIFIRLHTLIFACNITANSSLGKHD